MNDMSGSFLPNAPQNYIKLTIYQSGYFFLWHEKLDRKRVECIRRLLQRHLTRISYILIDERKNDTERKKTQANGETWNFSDTKPIQS